MSVKKAAQGLIKKNTVIKEGLLNTIEMAYRAYDPCMACATHTLPGQMPLEVTLRNYEGEVIERLTKNLDG
jgi:F420-non-reducing hydrogenase large subunit